MELLQSIYNVVWSPVLVAMCLGVGLFFSIRSRFVQLRLVREMLRLIFQKSEDEAGVSSFQALSMTLAGRVGTGNIAGVATAICYGGPGALFWMWIVAFLGASSAFVESTLGQIYKEKINGEYTGGPAFYIENGAGSKFFAWVFALITIAAAGFMCPGIQSNSIASAAEHAFDIDPTITAAVVCSLLCFVIFGGLKRIANFTTIVVPFMAQAYIVIALIVVFYNYEKLPETFGLIFSSAFGLDSAMGGIVGAAVSWGVKRGIFSNEAGQGSGPHASSAAAVSHPAKQGLVQAFSVYIDTWFVCTATGLMILTTGCYNVIDPAGTEIFSGLSGIQAGPTYTQAAVDQVMPGFGSPFIAFALFFFAFTTILSYGYIAETNIKFLNRTLKKPRLVFFVRVSILCCVAMGAIKGSDFIWLMGDIGIGLMAWVNLFAIIWLQKPAFIALRDYEAQRLRLAEPVFHPERIGISNAKCWSGNQAEEDLQIEVDQGVSNQPQVRGVRSLLERFYNRD